MYSQIATALVIVSVVLPAAAAVAVALRFRARSLTTSTYGADDWLVLAALIVQLGSAAMSIYSAIDGGMGDSVEHLKTDHTEYVNYEKVVFVAPLFYAIIVSLVKTSILFFYIRIFPTKHFTLSVYIVMGVVAAWGVTHIAGNIASSVPFHLHLGPFSKPFDYPAFLLAMSCINIALDFTILILPLFVIRKLHMSRRRKVGVLGIFWLGAFCVVASVMRAYYLVLLIRGINDITEDSIWAFVESCCSILAGCLPTLAPLWGEKSALRTMFHTIKSAVSFGSSKRHGSDASDEPMNLRREDEKHFAANVRHRATISSDTTSQFHDLEAGEGIHVQRDFEVRREVEPASTATV